MNYTGPKVKLSRKIGIPITPKASKIMDKKPYPPGAQGGNKRSRKQSHYSEQLKEKQKLRFQYNVSEKQLSNYYVKAKKQKGITGENLIILLERRLDALVLRAGLAKTIYAARQFVVHGHIIVNGKKADKPSMLLKGGDRIGIKEKSKTLKCFHEALKTAPQYQYINTDKPKMEAVFLNPPMRSEIPIICNEALVIEFYSK